MPRKFELSLDVAKVAFAADEVEQLALSVVVLEQAISLASIANSQRIEAAFP